MTQDESEPVDSRQEAVDSFLDTLSDPVHRRIVGAYRGNNPVEEMEKELLGILEEIVKDED